MGSEGWTRREVLALLSGLWLGCGSPRSFLGQVFVPAGQGWEGLDFSKPNPCWNGLGPLVSEPQKLPLIRLTDRPIQLETPRPYFLDVFTPNAAFYVRYHLDGIPNAVDLKSWRLRLEGNFRRCLSFSFEELIRDFSPVSLVAVNQCSGNSRSRFFPRVAGAQWGNGAMGNAVWTGVRLKDLLSRAEPLPGTLQIQFQGLDTGKGPEGKGSHAFLKSLDLTDPALERSLVAYSMNGQPLPMLNGFPVRLVVPGKFATYWVKHLSWIRALKEKDSNFWMAQAYRIPATPGNTIRPEDAARGGWTTLPIGAVDMPVRSFLIEPDGSSKLPVGMPVRLRGIAFSGGKGVERVEVSVDGGRSWMPAQLGSDWGPYSFRLWEKVWKPKRPGRFVVAVRAFDRMGHGQPEEPIWNPGGYLWHSVEKQELVVGEV
ncbi:Twin-arginine translocation pathway signal protein [Candidatus Methylacidithermus pantelleriae]|uniref:Twin-arginine translocation pathway signal protein n=1 Tax=Candidatus Methylacidithermus pantelleriae TaxID=2744239 RepID=A0A8J2FTU1_9BACT|nr:Twin-arginine translocation pathway signal protein [Candidatus Methylacidithermus pantelleriae]